MISAVLSEEVVGVSFSERVAVEESVVPESGHTTSNYLPTTNLLP